MKKIFFSLAYLSLTALANAQCVTHKYVGLANKVFTGNLTTDDFKPAALTGNLFLTIDTTQDGDYSTPASYITFTNANELINYFSSFMKSIKVEGNYFNYYEMVNNSLFNSPLHQSFLVNSANNTYLIDIWNNPNDITKIQGLTVVRYDYKLQRTPY